MAGRAGRQDVLGLESRVEGRGVDPSGKTEKDAPITTGSLVIELSGYRYFHTERKSRLV